MLPLLQRLLQYLPNAEMTLDLEVNEVEVKVLTSLASVAENTERDMFVQESDPASSVNSQLSVPSQPVFSSSLARLVLGAHLTLFVFQLSKVTLDNSDTLIHDIGADPPRPQHNPLPFHDIPHPGPTPFPHLFVLVVRRSSECTSAPTSGRIPTARSCRGPGCPARCRNRI